MTRSTELPISQRAPRTHQFAGRWPVVGDVGLRLAIFVGSLLLQNSCRDLHRGYVAAPHKVGAASGSDLSP